MVLLKITEQATNKAVLKCRSLRLLVMISITTASPCHFFFKMGYASILNDDEAKRISVSEQLGDGPPDIGYCTTGGDSV